MDVAQLQRVQVPTDDGAVLVAATLGTIEDAQRPLAVLQHGFPDTPATWRALAPALVEAGYRVAMPWLRGYGPSLTGSDRTTSDRYAADLVATHAALDGDHRAVLVGHDWGAAAAWTAAGAAPWAAVVGIAVPPQPALHGFLHDLDQTWRSRYMLQAQLPVAGWLLREDLRPLVDLWLRWSPSYAPTASDLRPLRRALATVPSVRAALAPYRAHAPAGILGQFPASDGPVPTQPALLVHGTDDGCIHQRYAQAARRVLAAGHPRSAVWLVPGAGHWAHLEQPAAVADAVLSFLASRAAPAGAPASGPG